MAAHDNGRYDANLAQARARARRMRPRRGRLVDDTELRDTYPDRSDWHVCHETIYQALYHGGRRGLSRQYTAKLRTGRPLRKRRRRADERSPRFVAPALLIDQRPEIVELCTRIGDWEGDLITGRVNQSAIGTFVDRASRYVRLIHLPDGRRAHHLQTGIAATMADLPAKA